jgi:hypothetical protein
LQCAFPLDVLMVPSSAIVIAADGEHLTCSGFSLVETVCLGNFEFISDYLGSLSLSPGGTMQCRRRFHELNLHQGTYPTAGQDGGRDQGVPHGVKRGGDLQPPLSLKAQPGGFARSHHNHTKYGGRSGHDDGSPADCATAAGNLPPF